MIPYRGLYERISIFNQLMIWFLAISLIPCLILTGIVWWLSKRSVEKLVKSNLTTIAESKAKELEGLAIERWRDLMIYSRAPTTLDVVAKLTDYLKKGSKDSPEFKKAAEGFRSYLTYRTQTLEYENTYLFTPEGDLLLEVKDDISIGSRLKEGPLKDTELAKAFDRAITLLQPELSDFALYPGLDKPAAFLAGPLVQEGKVVGVAVVQLAHEQIDSVMSDYTGLGETGETIVGNAHRRRGCDRGADEDRPVRGVQAQDQDGRQTRRSSPTCGAGGQGVRLADRSQRPGGGRGLGLRPLVSLGHGGEAGRRRGLRAGDAPARRRAHSLDGDRALRRGGGQARRSCDHKPDF